MTNNPNWQDLHTLIAACYNADKYRLQQSLHSLKQRHKQNKPFDIGLQKLLADIAQSQAKISARVENWPTITFDEQLPVAAKQAEIAAAIASHQVVVIAGETGSGKTTQIPKICLALGLGKQGLIGHTQPRRLAARAVASRISDELKVPLGEQVGYQVRFTDQSNDKTLVKLMTDGILLAETQNDRYLNRYEVIIIDEAHERSLNIDFLLGYLKNILPQRPDLKVIITSATIDVQRFSRHFNQAPVIEVSGRTYPVEVRYRPLLADDKSPDDDEADEEDMYSAILAAVDELAAEDAARGRLGDILVFLSGEREIREAAEVLRKASLAHTEVVPLYARLTAAEQQKIFTEHAGRRIVLSTNVAETSLTVPGIRYVIDTGYARISRYSYKSKVQRLPIEPVSQASANQRKGRCGRVSEGICIRLYSEQDFNARPAFTEPEICRTNLAAVILQMLSLRLGELDKFPFLDAPDSRFIKDGFNLLAELGGVDKQGRITQIGYQLAKLPVDPRIGRMLIEANVRHALSEVMIIAAALSCQDPWERPVERQQAADQKHAEYRHEESDFLTYVNLWHLYEEQRQALSNNQLRQYCKKQFLSLLRMREWREIHRQLKLQVKELGFNENTEAAGYQAIHTALLSGLLSHIGNKDEEGDYKGARNRKFSIFPGSGQFKRKPKWIMAAELVETSKIYGRTVAKIEPEWLEPLAGNLTKSQYLEPHWSRKRGQVCAYEQISLYGLIIVPRRQMDFSKIEPQKAHEIFVREALVAGQYESRGDFRQHNQALIEEIQVLEEKSRRRDIVVDDEALVQFYLERIPVHISAAATFEKWRKDAEQENPALLHLSKEYLMQHSAGHVTEGQFPDHIQLDGKRYPLSYLFQPGHAEDGVSLLVPLPMLKQLPVGLLQWLVPGMLRDKCIALFKNLPKPLRRQIVPVPGFVDEFLASEFNRRLQQPLLAALAGFAWQQKRLRIEDADWQYETLDPHYLMNLKVVDGQGEMLAQGRDWQALLDATRHIEQQALAAPAEEDFERENLTNWDFNDIPAVYERQQLGLKISLYPALVRSPQGIALKLIDRPDTALYLHRQGTRALLMAVMGEQVKWLEQYAQKKLNAELIYFTSVGSKTDLLSSMIQQCFCMVFPLQEAVRDQATFQRLLEKRGELAGAMDEFLPLVRTLLKHIHELQKGFKKHNQLAYAMAMADLKQQFARLLPKNFLADYSLTELQQLPRYLQAMLLRMDKLAGNVPKDRAAQLEVNGFEEKLQALLVRLPAPAACFPDITEFRWLLEEFRVSLFAQTLGTNVPVSAKRLQQKWLSTQDCASQ